MAKLVRIPIPYVKLKETVTETKKEEINYPKGLGEEHPCNFEQLEQLYIKVGLVKAIVDKYVDYIVSPGVYVKGSKQSANLVNNFVEVTNFDVVVRSWVLEGIL